MGLVDFGRAVLGLPVPGQGHQQRPQDEQVAGQRRQPGRTSWRSSAWTRCALTLVFASPPEDDIDWADVSPGGSLRFLQRAWRLSGDVTSAPGAGADGRRPGPAQAHAQDGARGRRADRDPPLQRHGRPHDGAGQRHPQGDRLRLRTAPTRPCARPSRRSRSCCRWWRRTSPRRCGSGWATSPTVARAGWPVVDEALLVEDSVTAVVQIQGKVRARLEVVARHLRGRPGGAGAGRRGGRASDRRSATVRKVIVRRAQAGQHRV